MKRGMTLLEVLVCIAIVVIVAAVAFPVVVNAKEGALKSISISNMRQVHLALMVYAQDHDGAQSGTMEAMGLPPWASAEFLGEQVQGLYPPMRTSAAWHAYAYNPMPSREDKRSPNWAQYTEKVGSSAVLLYDPFFNPPSTPDYGQYWQDPYVRKFVMGVTVSGSLVKRTRAGHLDLQWWIDEAN